ncbi:MAG: HPr family phosphocarrier protein [Candidatus Omnitrophica bacterium]|nr:HPr family phosphocarrier protein [Candidatus Omnitrophota bacterium]
MREMMDEKSSSFIEEDINYTYKALREISNKKKKNFYELINAYLKELEMVLSKRAFYVKQIARKKENLEPWEYDENYESFQDSIHYGQLFYRENTEFSIDCINLELNDALGLLKEKYDIDLQERLKHKGIAAVIGFGKNYGEILAITKRFPGIKKIYAVEIYKEFIEQAKEGLSDYEHLSSLGFEPELVGKVEFILANIEDLQEESFDGPKIESGSVDAVFTFGVLERCTMSSGGYCPDIFAQYANPDYFYSINDDKILRSVSEIHRILRREENKRGLLFSISDHKQNDVSHCFVGFDTVMSEDKYTVVALAHPQTDTTEKEKEKGTDTFFSLNADKRSSSPAGSQKVEADLNIIIDEGFDLHEAHLIFIVELARRFNSRITLAVNKKLLDAKNMLEVIEYGYELCNTRSIKFSAEGEDAQNALKVFKLYFKEYLNAAKERFSAGILLKKVLSPCGSSVGGDSAASPVGGNHLGSSSSQSQEKVSRKLIRLSITSSDTTVPKDLKKAEKYINENRLDDCLKSIIKILQTVIVNMREEPNTLTIKQLIGIYVDSGRASKDILSLLEDIVFIISEYNRKQTRMRKLLKPLVKRILITIDRERHNKIVKADSEKRGLKIIFDEDTGDDKEAIKALIKQKSIINEVFSNIFKRPDLTCGSVKSIYITYLAEGGFKKVYKASIRLRNRPYVFRFLIKAVKKDVKKSDSGYQYNAEYAKKLVAIARRAREVDLSLHLPTGGFYNYKESDGKERIVFTEGLIPETIHKPSDEVKGRIAVAAYLRYWKAFNEELYFEDPKFPNVVIQRLKGRYKATIIDIDNVHFGRKASPFAIVDAFLVYGFECGDIILGVIDSLPDKEAQEFIISAAARLNISRDPRGKELIELFEVARNEVKYMLPNKSIGLKGKNIFITVNGMRVEISEGITLWEVMQDCYADIKDTQVIYNGWIVRAPDIKQKESMLENIELSEGDEITLGEEQDTVFTNPSAASPVENKSSLLLFTNNWILIYRVGYGLYNATTKTNIELLIRYLKSQGYIVEKNDNPPKHIKELNAKKVHIPLDKFMQKSQEQSIFLAIVGTVYNYCIYDAFRYALSWGANNNVDMRILLFEPAIQREFKDVNFSLKPLNDIISHLEKESAERYFNYIVRENGKTENQKNLFPGKNTITLEVIHLETCLNILAKPVLSSSPVKNKRLFMEKSSSSSSKGYMGRRRFAKLLSCATVGAAAYTEPLIVRIINFISGFFLSSISEAMAEESTPTAREDSWQVRFAKRIITRLKQDLNEAFIPEKYKSGLTHSCYNNGLITKILNVLARFKTIDPRWISLIYRNQDKLLGYSKWSLSGLAYTFYIYQFPDEKELMVFGGYIVITELCPDENEIKAKVNKFKEELGKYYAKNNGKADVDEQAGRIIIDFMTKNKEAYLKGISTVIIAKGAMSSSSISKITPSSPISDSIASPVERGENKSVSCFALGLRESLIKHKKGPGPFLRKRISLKDVSESITIIERRADGREKKI